MNRGGGGRLIKSRKNSGGCAVPRNIGIDNAKGDYLFFVDSDDFITETALEEMYTVAKDFDAEVVACEQYFEFIGGNVKMTSYIGRSVVEEPTLISNNLFERVADIAKKNFIYSACMKLISKKFLSKENLKMLNIVGEDALLTWCMLCVAKRYVVIPNVIYFYRRDGGPSLSSDERDVEKLFRKWLNSIVKGFAYLDKFLDWQEFFRKHEEQKYIVLDTLLRDFNNYLLPVYNVLPFFELDKIVRKEFSRAGDKTALMAYLFSRMNLFNVEHIKK